MIKNLIMIPHNSPIAKGLRYKCSIRHKGICLYRFFIILVLTAATFFHNNCSSHETPQFKRLKNSKITINDQKKFSLKEDFHGDLYFLRGNVTFPFFVHDHSLTIKSSFAGDTGVYFVLFSKSKDSLEIYKKNSVSDDKPVFFKKISLDRGFNEIFFRSEVKINDSFSLKSTTGKKIIASTPIAYKIIPPSERKYVFLISVDTLSALHMSLYGYNRKTTPHVDSFSQDAVVFKNSYANSSWTVSSHMCLFTSLLEHRHRVLQAKSYTKKENNEYAEEKRYIFPLSPSIPFLIENISRNFITISLNGGGNVSAHFGFFRGFDLYMSNNDQDDIYASKNLFENTRKNLLNFSFPQAFYFLHTYHVHTPYKPEKSCLESVDKNVGIKTFDLNEYRGHRDMFRTFPTKFVNDVKSLYDAEILSFDKAFGDFIAFLKSSGIYDNATIILLSDHGEEFLEHDSWNHATDLYNEQIKIPLIIKFPNQKFRGKKISANVSLLDVMPTLLDYYGIDSHLNIAGKSLMGIIAGNDKSLDERFVVSSIFRSKPFSFLPGKIALIHKGFKLIFNEPLQKKTLAYFHKDPPFISKYELYDLKKDKNERVNLFGNKSKSKQIQRIFKTLVELVKQMKKNKINAVDRKKVKIPEELIEQLKTLGYLE